MGEGCGEAVDHREHLRAQSKTGDGIFVLDPWGQRLRRSGREVAEGRKAQPGRTRTPTTTTSTASTSSAARQVRGVVARPGRGSAEGSEPLPRVPRPAPDQVHEGVDRRRNRDLGRIHVQVPSPAGANVLHQRLKPPSTANGACLPRTTSSIRISSAGAAAGWG